MVCSKKTCMQAGLKDFLEKQHMHLLKGRKEAYWSEQSYNLVTMLHNVRESARRSKKGSRLAPWLQHLVDMIDLTQSTASEGASTIEAEKHKFLSAHVECRRRPLLRRHSTEVSSASTGTVLYSTGLVPEPQPAAEVLEALEDHMAESGHAQDGSVHWINEVDGLAMALVCGKEMSSDKKYADDSGMLAFVFPDGHRWVSSLPALGNVAEKHAQDMLDRRMCKSKAAPKVAKRPAGSSKKHVYSRAYHKVGKGFPSPNAIWARGNP